MKQQAFFENAILLTGKLKIIPLIYNVFLILSEVFYA